MRNFSPRFLELSCCRQVFRSILRRFIHRKPWQMRPKHLLPSRREASAVLQLWGRPDNKKCSNDRTASAALHESVSNAHN